jgi:hypothetical protein
VTAFTFGCVADSFTDLLGHTFNFNLCFFTRSDIPPFVTIANGLALNFDRLDADLPMANHRQYPSPPLHWCLDASTNPIAAPE